MLVRQNLIDPRNRSFGNFAIELFARGLIRVQIVFQQLGIVVRHFLEMRHAPPFIDRIPMESTADLIAKTTRSHAIERTFDHAFQRPTVRPRLSLQQQIENA